MADYTRALGDEAKKKEDAWAYERERALREKARQAEQRKAWRARLAQVVGVSDETYLDDLEEHGFAPETVLLLFTAPLFLVAWSDGEVTSKERAAILDVARGHGLEPGSPAWARLEGWLAARPGPAFFGHSLSLLKRMLDANPAARPKVAREIMEAAALVAGASGGFFGMGNRVSGEERTELERIAEELGVALDPQT